MTFVIVSVFQSSTKENTKFRFSSNRFEKKEKCSGCFIPFSYTCEITPKYLNGAHIRRR